MGAVLEQSCNRGGAFSSRPHRSQQPVFFRCPRTPRSAHFFAFSLLERIRFNSRAFVFTDRYVAAKQFCDIVRAYFPLGQHPQLMHLGFGPLVRPWNRHSPFAFSPSSVAIETQSFICALPCRS